MAERKQNKILYNHLKKMITRLDCYDTKDLT